MKIQDLFFIFFLIFLLLKNNHSFSAWAGLLCFLLSAPLFYFWIFFTAERLTMYGAGFILLSALQLIISQETIQKIIGWIWKIIGILSRNQKILFWLLIAIISINFINIINQNRDKYLSFDYWERYEKLKYLYENSQYVQKNPKTGWIPDEFVNAYAGGAYIKGVNPILIGSDTPPLGRYLIGFSALVFKNENIVILFSAVASLVFLYLLGFQIFKNQILALFPPLFFSFEPIFKNQLVYTPLLDILQLPFLLLCFIFFNKIGQTYSKHRFLYSFLMMASLGAFISIKYYLTGFIILGAGILTFLWRKNLKSFFELLVFSPIALFILLASYLRVLYFGETFRSLLGIQKYVFLYHQSQFILPFSIWPLILFNKWYVWFGDKPVISDPQWRISWPVILITSLVVIFLYFLKKISLNPKAEIVMFWVILYLLSFSFGQITSRYFVILIPHLYLLTFAGIFSLLKNRLVAK